MIVQHKETGKYIKVLKELFNLYVGEVLDEKLNPIPVDTENTVGQIKYKQCIVYASDTISVPSVVTKHLFN